MSVALAHHHSMCTIITRSRSNQFQHDNLKLFQYILPTACIFITPFLKTNSRAGCDQEQVTYGTH